MAGTLYPDHAYSFDTWLYHTKHAILSNEQLSEEAAEARNKHFRMYRVRYARKFSREVCNRDILNRLLLSSDPFLSCSRQRPRKRSKPFTSETLSLLLPGKPSSYNSMSNEDDVDEDEVEEDEDGNFEESD